MNSRNVLIGIVLWITWIYSTCASFTFESSIYLSRWGVQFQPRHPLELLSVLFASPSILRCSIQCNRNRRCRTFDHDQSSRVCRLFEGEFLTGTLISNTTLLSSRVGAVRFNTSQVLQAYSSYNQTCDRCSSGANRYLQCVNNTCQCPVNTYWNGELCLNQVYNGSNCSSAFASCRTDLNLTCSHLTNTCALDKGKAAMACISHETKKTV